VVRRVGRMVQAVVSDGVGISAQVPIEPAGAVGDRLLRRQDLLAAARSSIDRPHHMLGITSHAVDHR
jgi:hypothetical protein